ncbi:L,D-transpeptidase [Oceanomicrobium pacificus]|uniref:L,D-transpeptidase family protein n=1 Tax=Oceanomicrobium pacificus TaxID=2692916 RepID=A0A6B0TX08_9RHOB|nr:L,D-transpeptidase [Oceanomicrobium pacificus]MXU65694.1 L,D-transpeptidase family protein [Oceanomicrobium pacificus]
MSDTTPKGASRIASTFDRRQILKAGLATGAALAAPSVLHAQRAGPAVDRKISGLQTQNWQNHFSSLDNGAILCDTRARALHYWSADGSIYKIYPTSVPLTDSLTRRGRTRIVQKREGPDWRPTPNMLKRDPTLPAYVGPGPENPLGTHALYLSWEYYRIHGTNDVRKIGRQSSNGCIGLFNDQIAELFGMAQVGTQVLMI